LALSPFSQASYLKSTLRERMTTKSFPPKPQLFKTILARFDVPSTRKLNKNTTQTNHTTTHETGRQPAAQTQSPGSSSTPKHPSAARRNPCRYGTGSLRNPQPPNPRRTRSGTYWSVGTMPEGCLDRSTGWLPSSPGSAIRITHATSAAPRHESGPNPRPKWAGKERACHGFEREFEIRVFYRDRERSRGGGKARGR
jgi:hypothetical protein